MNLKTIRYACPEGVNYDRRPGLLELPKISVTVDGTHYFADSWGYLMCWSDETVSVEMPELDETGRKIGTYRHVVFVADNAYWYDWSEFGGNIPDEVRQASEDICYALSVLHGIDLEKVDAAYELRD